MNQAVFDIEAFLAKPLVARLATNGPTIRPLWYLWEDHAFWIITGEWSSLTARLRRDPHIALVVDTCDLTTGEVLQVTATGQATIEPYDQARADRKLRRYLGAEQDQWSERFTDPANTGNAFIRLAPQQLTARDLSY
jgi:nitroimidazol reductase NimA-like FMN-containing flavoprotein (pyridoxamine 5'-phosphate oxidase superfamily)